MLYWGLQYIKSYYSSAHITKRNVTMINITLPVAVVISAALIAGAMLVTSGIYEFQSQRVVIVQRYNRLTGSIYICQIGEPCVSMKEFKSH
jgi:hypothetical protein